MSSGLHVSVPVGSGFTTYPTSPQLTGSVVSVSACCVVFTNTLVAVPTATGCGGSDTVNGTTPAFVPGWMSPENWSVLG